MSPAWPVEARTKPAGAFHARPLPEPATRQVWVCHATGPALVLGSAQREEVVDRAACDAAGVAVVRRRSGGGAVLVEPGRLLWVDVVLPAGDPLWRDDVGHAFHWLGDVWVAALAELGVTARAHHGALVRTAWSDLVCFAGIGPGEVLDEHGAKVVGISQRRTRAAARFQCAALLGSWRPEPLLGLLALDAPTRAEGARALTGVAAGLPVAAEPLLDAVLRHLP